MEDSLKKEVFITSIRQVLPYTRSMMEVTLVKKIGTENVFNEAIRTLFEYMVSGVDAPLTRVSAQALSIQVLGCLVEYLNSIDVPPTLTNVIQNLHLLGYSVSQQYPYYYESKLLRFLISSTVSSDTVFFEAST